MINMSPNPTEIDIKNDSDVTLNGEAVNSIEVDKKENIALGILGAFLFSLVGALVYIGIYQLGFIAGIAGVVSILLANYGYGLFSGVKNTMRGIVFAIIFSVVAIVVAEYLCLVIALFSVWGEAGISFIECAMYTPELVATDAELLVEVIKELAIAIVLCAIASGSLISKKVKLAKNK